MDGRPGMLAKIMVVGMLGMIATMGMLLYSLSVLKTGVEEGRPERISRMAFRSLMMQGEVLECSVEGGKLTGRRRGMRPGSTSRFELAGAVSVGLLREVQRRKIPIRQGAPAVGEPAEKKTRTSRPANPPPAVPRKVDREVPKPEKALQPR